MAALKYEQTEWIRADLIRRGLLYPPLREEIVDHICDAVEAEMASGIPFMDAYRKVVASFGPEGLSELNHQTFSAIGKTAMLRNYLKLAVRNLRSRWLYAGINLLGLVLGLSSCLLILVYVLNEWRYDRHHVNADRIYRITTQIISGDEEQHAAISSGFLQERLEENYPEVAHVIRLQRKDGKIALQVPAAPANGSPTLVKVEQVYSVADPAFFQVFTHPMLAGNPLTALAQPYAVVITESLAARCFGSTWQEQKNILGKQLSFNGQLYQVSGVISDLPTTSDLSFEALLSMTQTQKSQIDWAITYVLFRDKASGRAFKPELDEIAVDAQREHGEDMDAKIVYHLENLRDVHFSTPKLFDTPKANRAYLYIFSVVAGLILLTASINYVNLAIAQSAVRSVEVGIRKVVGAARNQLLFQFISESMLLTLAALVLSLVLVGVLSPLYGNLMDKQFRLAALFEGPILLALVVMWVLVGGVAGSYPALYLTSLDPIRVLKGRWRLGANAGKGFLRQFLIVLQFTVSIAMMGSTLAVYRQLRYLQTTHVGFEHQQIVVLNVPSEQAAVEKMPALRNALDQYSQFPQVALVGYNSLPGRDTDVDAFGLEKGGQMVTQPFSNINVDEYYLATLNIPLVAGRNFNPRAAAEGKQEFIVNETLVRKMGWDKPETAIGKGVNQGPPDGTYDGEIVGVVKDFHFRSLHKSIEPMVLLYGAGRPEHLIIRLSTSQLPDHLRTIRREWQRLVPQHALSFSFLDDRLAEQYRHEQRLVPIFTYFTGLTIFVACLGLFGVVLFTTRQRTKEIGIRKVMGATEWRIVYLLSKEFIGLVTLAALLAIPLAWYAVHRWLEGFAYRTEIGLVLFLLAGLAALAIALLTVGYYARRAARTNPVRALRYE